MLEHITTTGADSAGKAVLSGLALEGSLEFPDRVRFFDREPFSVTLVGAGRTFETNHLALRVVRIATPLLETSLKLDTTAYASQL